ncbi:MAG: hypothetical protein KBA95_06800 [Acidobacteria bacterium]|nr:hypothetical protein [Acidobacteriota bacterium]
MGLTVGGIHGELLAALLVKSLPLSAVRWLVIFVVLYAAFTMLRTRADRPEPIQV